MRPLPCRLSKDRSTSPSAASGGNRRLSFTVPAGTTAELVLPAGEKVPFPPVASEGGDGLQNGLQDGVGRGLSDLLHDGQSAHAATGSTVAARWNCACGICKIRSVVNSLIVGGCRTYVPEPCANVQERSQTLLSGGRSRIGKFCACFSGLLSLQGPIPHPGLSGVCLFFIITTNCCIFY